jgi:nucleoside-diphosphate-sugar epimerase
VSVALVTGATGLVGSHIVDRLMADGWSVRALVRSPQRARDVLPEAVELISGDVLDEASFARAAAGCHAVFHTAANITSRGGWEAYRVTNVEGTRNAIMAAERSRARLLQLSSVAVYGPSARYDAAKRGEKTDEDTVLGPLRETAYYPRSKRESEAMVLDAHAQGRVWATAVRPSVIYGRRDRQFVPRIALVIKRGVIPLLRGGRATMSVVHAANVAEGAVLAATSDIAGGKAYNLANDYDVTVRRFFELAGEGLEKHPLLIPMPLSVAKGAMRAAKWIARRAGLSIVSNSAVDFLAENNPFSSERARTELGWKPAVRPEVGVPDAFRWWKESREEMKRARH